MLLSLINNGKSGLILFSSSTGEPKAMLHDLDNLIITYNTIKNEILFF